MKVAIIIPAWNESKHIYDVVKRTKKVHSDVIVVDDGSKDTTTELAKRAGATSLRHILNMGKGAAAKTGCDYAYQKGYDVLILMDADGQHLPEDIPRFLEALKGKDIVFGYRESNKNAPLLMNIGNWGLTKMSEILFGMPLKDTQSGYRAFTRKAYKRIRWKSTDYAMESEMIYKAQQLRFAQIPIKRIYLDNEKGTTVIHGLKIGWQMIKWKLLGGI